MDEFIKITPGQRKVLEVLATLKPYEEIVIRADKDAKFDTFWVKRESKMIITGIMGNFTK